MADGRYTRARTRTHAHTHTERLFTRTNARTPARRRYIKEFEASHGTVADLWHAHLRGEETSFNPLGTSRARTHARTHTCCLARDCDARAGMAEALLGAMTHAATLDTVNQARAPGAHVPPLACGVASAAADAQRSFGLRTLAACAAAPPAHVGAGGSRQEHVDKYVVAMRKVRRGGGAAAQQRHRTAFCITMQPIYRAAYLWHHQAYLARRALTLTISPISAVQRAAAPLRQAMHRTFLLGEGTRDMSGAAAATACKRAAARVPVPVSVGVPQRRVVSRRRGSPRCAMSMHPCFSVRVGPFSA